jgi:hypothetical protein
MILKLCCYILNPGKGPISAVSIDYDKLALGKHWDCSEVSVVGFLDAALQQDDFLPVPVYRHHSQSRRKKRWEIPTSFLRIPCTLIGGPHCTPFETHFQTLTFSILGVLIPL